MGTAASVPIVFRSALDAPITVTMAPDNAASQTTFELASRGAVQHASLGKAPFVRTMLRLQYAGRQAYYSLSSALAGINPESVSMVKKVDFGNNVEMNLVAGWKRNKLHVKFATPPGAPSPFE